MAEPTSAEDPHWHINSQLLAVQILTNDVQVLILCLSYLITTVKSSFVSIEIRNFI